MMLPASLASLPARAVRPVATCPAPAADLSLFARLPDEAWRPVATAIQARQDLARGHRSLLQRLFAWEFAACLVTPERGRRAELRAHHVARLGGPAPEVVAPTGPFVGSPQRWQGLRLRLNRPMPNYARRRVVLVLANHARRTGVDSGAPLAGGDHGLTTTPVAALWDARERSAWRAAGGSDADGDLIGNLALCPPDFVANAHGLPFDERRAVLAALGGESLPVNADIFAAARWTPQVVRARTERLAEDLIDWLKALR